MPPSLVNRTGFFESLSLPQNDRALEWKTFRMRSKQSDAGALLSDPHFLHLSFMKSLRLLSALFGFLLVIGAAHRGVCAPPSEPPAKVAQPAAKLPTLTVPVRVHLMQSQATPAMHTTLVESDVRRIFGKANMVWSQAGIQFEIESIVHTEAAALSAEVEKKDEFVRVNSMIPKASLSTTALNVCYVKEVKPNGFFHSGLIVVKDTASLKPVEGGIDEPLPRVTSHEIGHALGLSHRQDTTNLMASGRTGFSLNDAEIKTAREKAKAFQTTRATGAESASDK